MFYTFHTTFYTEMTIQWWWLSWMSDFCLECSCQSEHKHALRVFLKNFTLKKMHFSLLCFYYDHLWQIFSLSYIIKNTALFRCSVKWCPSCALTLIFEYKKSFTKWCVAYATLLFNRGIRMVQIIDHIIIL